MDISALKLKIDVSCSNFLIICYDVDLVYSFCIECLVYTMDVLSPEISMTSSDFQAHLPIVNYFK